MTAVLDLASRRRINMKGEALICDVFTVEMLRYANHSLVEFRKHEDYYGAPVCRVGSNLYVFTCNLEDGPAHTVTVDEIFEHGLVEIFGIDPAGVLRTHPVSTLRDFKSSAIICVLDGNTCHHITNGLEVRGRCVFTAPDVAMHMLTH